MPEIDHLPATQKVIEDEFQRGSALGIQIYVSHEGRPVLDRAFGKFLNATPFQTNTLMRWMSAGKPLTAVALSRMKSAGLIQSWEDPVANYWPEFGLQGKDGVTLRHLLTHTGNFRNADRLVSQVHPRSWAELTEAVAGAPLEDPEKAPGDFAAYHTGGSWLVLGEIIRRLSGRGVEEVHLAFRDWVLDPAGMKDSWIGMTEEDLAGYEKADQLGWLHYTAGSDIREHPKRDQRSAFLIAQPGGGARGPVRELGRFYEIMLQALSGQSADFLSREAAKELVEQHRGGRFDETFQSTVDWGLGFMLNSIQYGRAPYQFGPHASPETFGHGGSQCSIGFADPENKLVVAWVWNTTPGEPPHQRRNEALNQAVYEDLSIAKS